MKRYKVKFTNPDTGKHEATRSYDEHELAIALTELNMWLLKAAELEVFPDINGVGELEECPLPSFRYRLYDRELVAKV